MTTLYVVLVVLAALEVPFVVLVLMANLAELKRWKSRGAGGT